MLSERLMTLTSDLKDLDSLISNTSRPTRSTTENPTQNQLIFFLGAQQILFNNVRPMLPLFDEPAETFINNRTFLEQKSQFSSNPHMEPLQELIPNATTLSREPR